MSLNFLFIARNCRSMKSLEALTPENRIHSSVRESEHREMNDFNFRNSKKEHIYVHDCWLLLWPRTRLKSPSKRQQIIFTDAIDALI